MSLYVREGWRQTDSDGGEGGRGAAHILCGSGEREQFIISAQFECINCLDWWKFTFYTTTLTVLFLMRATAVKLMC